MPLEKYKQKRDLRKTREPSGKKSSSKTALRFVVQKHRASHLHYDFRLELDGVLKSWAVPKGPSLDPEVKRLAVMVEDHPYDYGKFEGIIPEGNYGAGEVIVWDEGTYHSLKTEDRKESENIVRKELHSGDLKFVLYGKKMSGAFALVKMKGRGENSWLLIKKKDEFASKEDVTEKEESVISGKTLGDMKSLKSLIPNGRTSQKTKMPSGVRPMLATLVKKPFDDPDWLFEIKWDGYRAIAEIDNGKVNLHSRNNISFNQKFSVIAGALQKIRNRVILDGEIVVLNDEGRPEFQLLQNYQKTGEGNIFYYVFDILYLDGYDLRGFPLIERKTVLKDFLPEINRIRYGDHILSEGKKFYRLAQRNRLEGVMAKKSGSVYQADKRSKDWLKIKTHLRQEAVIAGFTKPRGGRKGFGALILGVYEGKELIYIGHTGGGFDDSELRELTRKLDSLIIKSSPFREKPKTNMPVTWIEPKLVCEVTFAEWTADGIMRQPVFMGLRDDKNPKEIKKELPQIRPSGEAGRGATPIKRAVERKKIGINKIKITNPDKIYFPDEGYTKGDIIEYYDKISKYILPYLNDRPESLNRHPDGIYKKNFFQKDMGHTVPEWTKTIEIYSESNKKNITYFVCNDKASLLYLVNLGCIEINPWFSRIQNLEYPDYAVMDLDPEGIGFDKVIETALVVKQVLDEAGAKSICNTSGATGLHIYIPLKAKYNYDIAVGFARLVGKIVNNRIPEITSLERNPSKRKGRVYLDYLQNRMGQTLAAPYSVRPKPGATVATPLEWSEVKKGLEPKEFTIKTIPKRLKMRGDIFKPVLGAGINIGKCIERLESINR